MAGTARHVIAENASFDWPEGNSLQLNLFDDWSKLRSFFLGTFSRVTQKATKEHSLETRAGNFSKSVTQWTPLQTIVLGAVCRGGRPRLTHTHTHPTPP